MRSVTMYGKILKGIVIILVTILIENGSVARSLNTSHVRNNTGHKNSNHERMGKIRQPERVKNGSSGWSSWSDWSICSRTCDGGVTQQIRHCKKPNGCKGDTIRYRICNLQQCAEPQDFRSQQCAAFNDIPYDGTYYTWTPYFDYMEPCALTCRGSAVHLPRGTSAPNADGSSLNDHELDYYDEQNVIVQLSPKVHDGTRCRPGSLDMCIQGKCRQIGCDLKIGSSKKVDACGVCGGDGKSCSPPLYQWEPTPATHCETCGGGYRVSRRACRDRVTGAEVEYSLCGAANWLNPSVTPCTTQDCPPRWVVDDWSPCSHLCGPGYRERMVVCAEEANGIKTRVADFKCRSPKPLTQELCMIQECPQWEVEEWSLCSVSCGYGIQMRGVECKARDGSLSAKCDPHTKPSGVQQCTTGLSCIIGGEVDEPIPNEEANSNEDDYLDGKDDRVHADMNNEYFEHPSYNDRASYTHQRSKGLFKQKLAKQGKL